MAGDLYGYLKSVALFLISEDFFLSYLLGDLRFTLGNGHFFHAFPGIFVTEFSFARLAFKSQILLRYEMF